MGDIILERDDQPNIMKLDDDEEAILNEIEIETMPLPTKPKHMMKPKVPKMPRMVSHAPDNLEAFTNPVKRTAPPKPPPEVNYDHGEEEDDMMFEDEGGDDYEMMGGGGGGGMDEQPSPGYSSIDDEKADLLNKLARLEKKGFNVNKKFSAYSDISELRTEYKRIMYSIEVEQSIRFSRRMLIACVTGVEFLNKRYDPFAIQLDGWSESVMENVDDYDGVFEELYSKYKTKMSVAPEIKLIMMLGGSAMMFHLTNSMFKTAIPNMNDVLKQNPDLVKNMVSAVQNTQARSGPAPDTTQRPVDTSGSREMTGPNIDLSSLMNGIMMPPPPPMNTSTLPPVREEIEHDDTESLSDIVSISGESTGGEVREVKVSKGKGKRGRPSKKNEVTL
jgi:hypothetical protein